MAFIFSFYLNLFCQAQMDYAVQGTSKSLCHKNTNSNNFYWSPFLPLQKESPSFKRSRMLSATFINYSFILINYASQIFHYHWGYQLRLLQLLAIFIPLIYRKQQTNQVVLSSLLRNRKEPLTVSQFFVLFISSQFFEPLILF